MATDTQHYPSDGLAYQAEQTGKSFSITQRHGGRIVFLSAIQFDSLHEAQEHADGLNFLREKRLRSTPEGKGLHWPPSRSSLR